MFYAQNYDLTNVEEVKNFEDLKKAYEEFTKKHEENKYGNPYSYYFCFNTKEIPTEFSMLYQIGLSRIKFEKNYLIEIMQMIIDKVALFVWGENSSWIKRICLYQPNISKEFVEKFRDKIQFEYLYNNTLLSRDFLKEMFPHEYKMLHTKFYGYHDSQRPSIQFVGGEDDGKTLFLGVENELDVTADKSYSVRTSTKKDIICKSNELFGTDEYCIYMYDGSLRNGMEQITQPTTLKKYIENADKFQQIFDYASEKGFKNRVTCGLHIHFNRSFFGTEYADLYTANLLYLTEKFWKELVIFSRRDYNHLSHWADKYYDKATEIVKKKYHSRYHAVNLTNKNTIEFRMFKATNDVSVYIATLTLVSNLVKQAKTHNLIGLQKLTFEDLLTDENIKKYWNKVNTAKNIEKVTTELTKRRIKNLAE